MNILGLSAYYHDSSAALLKDGIIVAAAQEERFSRKKHDSNFPKLALDYCLQESKITLEDVDYIVFFDKPLIKFERLLETYLAFAPRGICSFLTAMPVWIKEKVFLKSILRKELSAINKSKVANLPPIFFNDHHRSHAASAFFPSPFKKAAVMCLDGVGEWATSSIWLGEEHHLTPQWQLNFPHSLGLLYSAFTYYLGFKVNSGEYKLMGLAPYGEPEYVDLIYKNLLDLKEDRTFCMNMKYFNYATGLTMTNGKFNKLFGGPPRKPESEITQKEMNIARSIQIVTEEIILKLAKTIHKELNVDNLCLAGGVSLNCVANGRLLREGPFKDIWIQPAAGDAGGALGAAYSLWHEYLDNTRIVDGKGDAMRGSYLGGGFSNEEIKKYLDTVNVSYVQLEDFELMPKLAKIIEDENVVGWFNGRMEFGPRALGGRSIVGDPRSKKMQSTMNMKIKHRESFRPFAPAIKADRTNEWFQIDRKSPYMLLVAPVKNDKCLPINGEYKKLFGIEKLKVARSEIPAVTHVDYSARIQTVHKETNPRFFSLIEHFEKLTQCPILINTSFNVRGEPIVYTPEDAYRCFMRTEMDYLVMENILINKKDQSDFDKNDLWKEEFLLD